MTAANTDPAMIAMGRERIARRDLDHAKQYLLQAERRFKAAQEELLAAVYHEGFAREALRTILKEHPNDQG